MEEFVLILMLMALLCGVVSLRFFFLLCKMKKDVKIERNWFNEEMGNEEYIRHSKYFED